MQITFHGAAHTVTGSQHLIEVNHTRILLDCGLYQGKRSEARKRNRELPFDPSTIDVMVLSHAHIDHSGNIPNLVKNGFHNDIYGTHATRDLCASMLMDSAHIQEKDIEYVNKKRKKKGEAPLEPIYTQEDARHALQHFVSIGYGRTNQIANGVYVTLYDAGHMLGSSIVVLDIEDHEDKKDYRIVFSGDIGRKDAPILRDPTPIDRADVLIMESTYGGRQHPPIPDAEADLQKVIMRAYDRGGKVIIPAFSVGRTQTVVYALNRLYHGGKIPNDLPVFVDSPLAVNATEAFRMHPEAFDSEALGYMQSEDPDGDLFGFSRLKYIRKVEDSKALNDLEGSAIIISASGMMEAGRILHHLKNNVEDPNNIIMVVGWQAPNTLGRRLIDKEPVVRIFGEEYTARAEVVKFNGYSGHADHDGLIEWAGAMEKPPAHTFLVHGEVESAEHIKKSLNGEVGFKTVDIPALHESFTV